MSEVKDPKIKLFGKTIELPETLSAQDSSNQEPPSSSDSMLQDNNFNTDVDHQDSPHEVSFQINLF